MFKVDSSQGEGILRDVMEHFYFDSSLSGKQVQISWKGMVFQWFGWSQKAGGAVSYTEEIAEKIVQG